MHARSFVWAAVLFLGSLAFAGCGSTTTGTPEADAGIDANRDAARVDAAAIDGATTDDAGSTVDSGTDDTGTADDAGADDAAASPDAATPPVDCSSNTDCTDLELCAAATCGAPGTCVLRPTACPDVVDPVCGCDGVTYGNACEAEAAGVNAGMRGACPTTGCALTAAAGCCFEDGDCGSRSERCVEETCAAGGEGTCVSNRLEIGTCWEDADCNAGETCGGASVCGCGMLCLLPDAPGRCAPSSGATCAVNTDCDAADYCARATGDCTAAGGCTTRPVSCTRVLDPVCGCDGTTYGNPCMAAMAGVSVAARGACSTASCTLRPAAGCCFTDDDCADGRSRCAEEMCVAGGEGTCVSNRLAPGECWESSDCLRGETCSGQSICECGSACLLPDSPGRCGGSITPRP